MCVQDASERKISLSHVMGVRTESVDPTDPQQLGCLALSLFSLLLMGSMLTQFFRELGSQLLYYSTYESATNQSL